MFPCSLTSIRWEIPILNGFTKATEGRPQSPATSYGVGPRIALPLDHLYSDGVGDTAEVGSDRRAEVTRRLVSLMELARARAAAVVGDAGLPLVVAANRPVVVERSEGEGFKLETVVVDVSIVFDPAFRARLAGLLDNEARDECLEVSALLVEIGGDAARWWTLSTTRGVDLLNSAAPVLVERYDDIPPMFVAERIVLPMIDAYLSRLPLLDSPDEHLVALLAGEAVSLAVSDHLRLRCALHVQGLVTPEGPIASGDLSVRGLTPQERGEIFNAHAQMLRSSPVSSIPTSRVMFAAARPTQVIELDIAYDRRGPAPEVWVHWRPVITSFVLHGYQLTGAGTTVVSSEPEWSGWTGIGMHVPIGTIPADEKPLSAADLDAVWKTSRQVAEFDLEHPKSPRDLAFHRVLSGATRENPADRFLDYVIALEILLLPVDRRTRHGDLTYRFRLHGALFLADSPEHRERVWDQLDEIYDIRSRLVHGDKYPDSAEVDEHAGIARDLAISGLLRALSDGFPTADTFRSLALVSGSGRETQ